MERQQVHCVKSKRNLRPLARARLCTMIVRSLFAMLLVSCLGLREGFGAPPPSAPPPAWPYEHEARIAEPVFGGYAQLYQAGVGQARRIVLVHGIGDNGARDFEPLVPWLVAQGFHVLAFDLPGFGRSDKTNALYSPANYAAFVKFVADRYVRRPFVLLGHSMGAVVALRYSADHPEDVERLIVMNAPGILHRLSYSSQFLAHLGMTFLPSFMNPAGRIADFAHKLFGRVERSEIDPEAILASPRLRASLLGGNPVQIAGLALVLEDFSTRLSRIEAPTLIVWGEKDTLAPVRTGKVLEAMLPRAHLVVLPNTGHVPMTENPRSLRTALGPFLSGEPAPPPPAAIVAGSDGADGGGRRARCERRTGVVFEGEYASLVINRCRQVVVRRARLGELRVLYSTVEIEDSEIGVGAATAGSPLYALSSTVIVTRGRIAGDVPLTTISSRLDLAGVWLAAREAAVVARAASSVVFSLSRLETPSGGARWLHGYYAVVPGKPLQASGR